MSRSSYRALICITTCRRLRYLRRYLPHYARFTADDTRFSLVVSLDGPDLDTREFCQAWHVPLVYSEEREGVGISKNRVLERFADFDYYFFLEDDVELADGSVFPEHVELARSSGIAHFSLFVRDGVRRPVGESRIAGHSVVHSLFGSADFNFFTAEGLRQVGGWHPRFAQYRRWGHTEHSYRFVRAGLAPAPFNVATDLVDACIWHFPPSVTPSQTVAVDQDQIAAPERELMDESLLRVPICTLSPYHFNGVDLGPVTTLAETLAGAERYPLLDRQEVREARSDYQLWRFEVLSPLAPRVAAIASAAWHWPANPMLRHKLRTVLSK